MNGKGQTAVGGVTGPAVTYGSQAATPAVVVTAGFTPPATSTGTAGFESIKHLLSGKPLKGIGKPKKK